MVPSNRNTPRLFNYHRQQTKRTGIGLLKKGGDLLVPTRDEWDPNRNSDWEHPDRLIRTRARWYDTGRKWRYKLLEFAMSWLGYDSLYDSRNQ